LRTPRESWYEVSGGSLTIRPRAVELSARAQPSFIGRRQQHLNASASTAMRYLPTSSVSRAGLVAFQSEDYFYALTVTQSDGVPVVQLQKRAGTITEGRTIVEATAPISVRADQPVFLRIDARGGLYDFYYTTEPGAWKLLKRNVDGTILSTRVAGGFSSAFVGTMFGLYAFAP
jgi:alpha-N-arabinofuranosidase